MRAAHAPCSLKERGPTTAKNDIEVEELKWVMDGTKQIWATDEHTMSPRRDKGLRYFASILHVFFMLPPRRSPNLCGLCPEVLEYFATQNGFEGEYSWLSQEAGEARLMSLDDEELFHLANVTFLDVSHYNNRSEKIRAMATAGAFKNIKRLDSAEMTGLDDLFSATGGKSWVKQSNWNNQSRETLGNRQGVITVSRRDHRVMQLDLPTNNLKGGGPEVFRRSKAGQCDSLTETHDI